MTDYIITPTRLVSETALLIQALPNFVSLAQTQNQIFANFNHTTNQQIKGFLWLLSDITDGVIIIDPQGQNITRVLSQYNKSVRSDVVQISEVYNQALTNLSTTYVNIFPNAVKNLRFPIDTKEFVRIGIVVTWNKNGGAGTHDFKLVDANDETKTLFEITNITTDQHENFTIDLSSVAAGHFVDSVKFIKAMAKSSNGTDDPVFVGLRVYLRR